MSDERENVVEQCNVLLYAIKLYLQFNVVCFFFLFIDN